MRAGDIDAVSTLLAAGADPLAYIANDDVADFNWSNATQIAVKLGHDEIFQKFVQLGILGSVDLNDLMEMAIKGNNVGRSDQSVKGHISTVKMLLKMGVDPFALDEDGTDFLSWAAYAGNVEMIDLFLSLGADVNFQMPDEQTALHLAVQQSMIDAICHLLDLGADPTLGCTQGKDVFYKCSPRIRAALDARAARIAILNIASQSKAKD